MKFEGLLMCNCLVHSTSLQSLSAASTFSRRLHPVHLYSAASNAEALLQRVQFFFPLSLLCPAWEHAVCLKIVQVQQQCCIAAHHQSLIFIFSPAITIFVNLGLFRHFETVRV